nr:MAG TPA_asm: hypothetical protein [Caudoviricetes sp.]
MATTSLARSGLTTFQKYSSLLAGNEAYNPGSYELIETVTLSSSQSSVTFSNLNNYSSTYQHLQLRLITRDTRAATLAVLHAQFNNDTGSNYAAHRLIGNGSSVSSANLSGVQFWLGYSPSNNAGSGIFAATVVDILDPFETTKNTTIRSFNGFGGAAEFGLFSGAWLNTNSISSIKIYPQSDNFAQYSRFSLYGLKGA